MNIDIETLFEMANEARKNVNVSGAEWKEQFGLIEELGLVDEFCDYVNRVEGRTIYSRFEMKN